MSSLKLGSLEPYYLNHPMNMSYLYGFKSSPYVVVLNAP
jgi:hypothetical protein